MELSRLQKEVVEVDQELAVARTHIEWHRRILEDNGKEIYQLKEDKALLGKALGEAKAKGNARRTM